MPKAFGAAKYTREQRDAILEAILVKGLKTSDAVRRAAAGELSVPAFTIPHSSALAIVRKDRDDYAKRNAETMRAAIDRDLLELAAIARRGARKLLDSAKAGGDVDPDAIARAVRALKTAQTALSPAPKPPAKPAPDQPPNTNGDVLARLGLNTPPNPPTPTDPNTERPAAPVRSSVAV